MGCVCRSSFASILIIYKDTPASPPFVPHTVQSPLFSFAPRSLSSHQSSMFAGASAIAAASAYSAFPHPCSRSSHAGSAAPRIGMPAAACRAAVQSFPDAACAVGRPRVPASLYHVLRIKRDASPVEIKSAYRTLAKMYHPDAAESDGRDFMEIHNAYATLSDPASRSLYDLSLGCGCARGRLSSSSSPGGGDRWSGFYSTRRWETDQCW